MHNWKLYQGEVFKLCHIHICGAHASEESDTQQVDQIEVDYLIPLQSHLCNINLPQLQLCDTPYY